MLFSGVGRSANEGRKRRGLRDGLAGTPRLPGRLSAALSNGGSAEQTRESEDKSSPHDSPLTAVYS
jgi:hypothetical protein